MGVTVDQAGREPAARAVDHLAGIVLRQVGGSAEPGDPAVPDRERAVLDRAVRRSPSVMVARLTLVSRVSQVGIVMVRGSKRQVNRNLERAARVKPVDRARPHP